MTTQTVSGGRLEMTESVEATIIKIEEDKQLVFGWANIIKTAEGKMLLDRQDDFIDDEGELEKAAYHYVLHSRDGGEMHVRKGVSTLVESVVLTDEKQRALGIPANTVPTGWWIGFKVNDESVWKQIKKGGYVGFSVHGTGRRERTPLDLHKYTDIEKDALVRENISKYIKQKPNGKWCVYSEAGKILGEYDSKGEAKKRLAQIEHFKKEQPTSSDVHVDSTDWDKRRRKKRILTNAALEKFNPNHDELGRFSSGPSGGGAAPKGGGKKRFATSGGSRVPLTEKEAAAYDKLSWDERSRYVIARRKGPRHHHQRKQTYGSHARGMEMVRQLRSHKRQAEVRQAESDRMGSKFKSGKTRRDGSKHHIMQVEDSTNKYEITRTEVRLTGRHHAEYSSLKTSRGKRAYERSRASHSPAGRHSDTRLAAKNANAQHNSAIGVARSYDGPKPKRKNARRRPTTSLGRIHARRRR